MSKADDERARAFAAAWSFKIVKHMEEETGARVIYLDCEVALREVLTLPSALPALLAETRKAERAKCIRDACMYCAGSCPPYETRPEGPNAAGNWVHRHRVRPALVAQVLCGASSILARARFEDAGLVALETEHVEAL